MEVAARTMRMNLHSLSKLGFLITFIVFIVVFLVTVIIGVVGPSPWVYLFQDSTIPIDAIWTTGLDVSKLNQRVIVYASIKNKVENYDVVTSTFTFTSIVDGLKKGATNFTRIASSVETRKVSCSRGQAFCEDVVVVNVPYIDFMSYQFNISTVNALGTGYTNIKYYFAIMNANFTLFELWFRFVFLVATVVIIIVYAVKLRGFEWKDWAIEQRWVAFLLFGLLAYNNPTFPLTILLDGAIWPFLDQVLLVSFLVVLMFFWIIMFDGIRTPPQMQTFKTFYLPKFIMLALFWIAAVVIFSWLELSQINDPAADVYSKPAFIVFYVIMIILLVIYLFWLSYVVFRAISSRNTMPYLPLRLKFFGVFTLLVLVVVIAGVLGGQVGPISNNAAQLLSFLSLLNLYVYTLAFVYFPSKDVVGRAKNSGMVKLEELEDATNAQEMETAPAPVSSQPARAAPAAATATTSTTTKSVFSSGTTSSSSAPAWKAAEAPAPTGPAPIKINFDGLDDDEDGTL